MTNRTALFLALAVLSFSCRRPDPGRRDAPPAPADGDLALLVGKWKIERAVADGKNYSVSYRQAKLEIAAGGKYTFVMPGLVEEGGTITIDPKKSPKEMDLKADGQALNRLQPTIDLLQDALGHARPADGRRGNPVQSAIYQLDGDDLTICLSMIEDRRPTAFETTADSWRVLMTCKRKKPTDKPKNEIAKGPAPPPLPEGVRHEWARAGAEVGWMGTLSEPVTLDFRTTPEALNDAVPAFRFEVWKTGAVGQLPVPKAPFGLYLVGTEATDAELKGLAALESLSALDLAFTKLTDDGLRNLSGLKSLNSLNIFATKVTDNGLKELANMKSLHTLDLRVLDVTDAGLKELAGLKNLKTLDLVGTKVTDAGLKELAGLSALRYLDLTDTRVTSAGVQELKRALPNCQILD
ncbi:TIGR03067 domain-containing protein [Frigoriglobus tundricola]|uniref:Uncharacterized protein n=1 Tax=Frigoriglobus tundricola TaxID=2774151 RepID=A0A6M5Z1I9_9BACT|nr:TIGR03067 domain-containing protein [Frigoriglobus tundricola]QJX00029.1 hypothetical protein FTUN_7651 [Frigoriglobus tundricola]